MSELTLCNFCTLQGIKVRYGRDKVYIRHSGHGWLEVCIEGRDEPVVWFAALTTQCCC
jgi:hypothetical protein